AVAREKWLAVTARFLQRLSSPRFQRSTFEITPQIRMEHEVLQVAICRAYRTAEPRRNKDANRSQPFRMNVEKAENFRLREANGVQDGSGLQSTVFPTIWAKFDDHLHAERPFARSVASRHSKIDVGVDLASYRSDRAVAHHGQRSAQVHARRETRAGIALEIGPLIGEPHASNGVSFNERFGDWHARPDLHHARRCNLIADPLIELAKRQHEAIVFPHERWGIG